MVDDDGGAAGQAEERSARQFRVVGETPLGARPRRG